MNHADMFPDILTPAQASNVTELVKHIFALLAGFEFEEAALALLNVQLTIICEHSPDHLQALSYVQDLNQGLRHAIQNHFEENANG